MGRNVALEARGRARPARGWPIPTDADAADAARHGQAGRASATASWPGWPARPRTRSGRARLALGLAPGLRDGRHVRRGVRGRDAVLLLDLRGRRLAARGAAGRRGRPRSSSARARSGSGRGSSSTTARSRPPTRSAATGWSAVMINSNPETVSTDFDASTRLYFEPLDPESVRSVIDAETRRRRRRSCRRVVAVRRPDAAQPRRAAGRGGRRRCSGSTSRRSTRPRSGPGSRRSSTGSGIPQPEGGMAHSIEEALTLAERIGYPVIVRPSFVIGGLAIDFCYSPDGPRPPARRRDRRRPRPARPDRPLPRGRRGRRRRRLRRRARSSSRGSSSTSSGPASTRATRSAMFPPQTVSRGRPGAHRGDDGADRAGARRRAASSTPSSSSATTAST